MNIEDFRNLIEAESIEKEIATFLKKQEGERSRIALLHSQIQKKKEELVISKKELEEISKILGQKEKIFSEAETRLKKLKANVSMITNSTQLAASEKELATLVPQIDQLEGELMVLYEQKDLLNKNIKDFESFIQGATKSEVEINIEASKICADLQSEIVECEERVKNLLSITAPELSAMYRQVQKKYRFNNALAFVERDNCNRCHMQVGKSTISMVERGTIIELCPGCDRLLTPISAKLT